MEGVDVSILASKIPSKKKLRNMLITKKVEANGCSPKQFSFVQRKTYQDVSGSLKLETESL